MHCTCRFTKSVIKSRAALTYAEAQTRIDDTRLTDDVSAGLRELNRIARILRRRRGERGALSLASPEVRFEIDTETHDPTDVGMYQVNLQVPLRMLKTFLEFRPKPYITACRLNAFV